MNTTLEQRLADALRPMAECLRAGITLGIRPGTPQAIAIREALAAYDAQQSRQPCRYLVRWEVDSDDATPEEAARAADGNTSRFYEVIEDNGTVNYVDLDAIDGEDA